MSKKYLAALGGVLVVVMLVLAACGAPTPAPTEAPAQPTQAAPTQPPAPTPVPEPTKPPVEIPNLTAWESSPHNDATAEAFKHWDNANPAEVPASCAKCHSTTGYQDFLGVDGSEAGKVDKNQPIGQTIQCVACHNDKTATLSSVTFPSGIEITGLGPEARCMLCHQGRESKVSVDKQIADFKATDLDAVPAPIKDAQGNDVRFGFRNIHYFPAAATLYGTMVKGGYEYDGKTYDAKNQHVEGFDTCVACHNAHTLQVKVDQCAQCHEGVKTVDDLKKVRMVSSAKDYDGDGNTTEGMAEELVGLQDILYAQIQTYAKDKTGDGIVYDVASYPYFFLDANGDGQPDKNDQGAAVGFSKWTPRLLKAAYNYQLSVKDPGSFAHGNKYIVELLYDSIEDLGGDVSKLARDDAGHFAGNTEPFRHWDAEGFTVPGTCARCHSATGLPQYLKEGATISNPAANGFLCTTCHDETNFPARYQVASVAFPSGATVSFGGKDADGKFVADDSNLCLECHQGRESTTSVNRTITSSGAKDDEVSAKIGFRNVHYFAAGATLFGTDVKGAYEYADQKYVGQNTEHPLNKCKDCHDVHALEPKIEACKACHGDTKPEDIRMDKTDYNGNGNTTEGIKAEIDSFAERLYAALQSYAEKTAGTPIVYNAAAYPYFFVDKDKNGEPDKNDTGANISYNAWTPRLLRAAYNYQYVQKDPGAFTHNPKYVLQFLYDSIKDLGGDVQGLTRPAAPAE